MLEVAFYHLTFFSLGSNSTVTTLKLLSHVSFSLSFEKNHAFSACGESVLVVLLESRGHILFTDFIIFYAKIIL